MTASPARMVECRQKNCHHMDFETNLVPAAKVLGRSARGYFCDAHAKRLKRIGGGP